ncbi:MAG: glycoside hydrolase family 65 protein [Caulobacter sp.]|nr:glycoside hydrolase family 65 protein [Caulobacter sp.]
MPTPLSPPPVKGAGGKELPAYLANGVMGLRIRPQPLKAGMCLVNGFAGEHPERRIEAAAPAPFPLAGDIRLDGRWLSDAPELIRDQEQAYDFASGELTSRFVFGDGKQSLIVSVVAFCDRSQPSLVCQEVTLEAAGVVDISYRCIVDTAGLDGRPLHVMRSTPTEDDDSFDGTLLWESAGGLATCGVAYRTELIGPYAEPQRPALQRDQLITEYSFRVTPSRPCRLRQMATLVPSISHHQPDHQAARLLGLAARRGFETARSGNQAAWDEIWRGRIVLEGAETRWQAMADAALFYLASSTHVASPASTSIFGLATWHDYHYYYGHVMWDVETFAVPALNVLAPDAARSLLDYRSRHLDGAASNARLRGRRGLQFPWESAPSTGQECAPLPGSASWHEDHVSPDIAFAFLQHAQVTGDGRFLRDKAWPVLSGVSDWIVSRATATERGFEILGAMGIAERKTESDNPAFTAMTAILVLRATTQVAAALGLPADPDWQVVADGLVLPRRGKAVVSHDDFRINEEKGPTPDPLMGDFPLNFPLNAEAWAATREVYFGPAREYLGSPMLSALYGVWAARGGDRALSLRMLEEGYGKFCTGRFLQTLEYRQDVFPEQPRAGPFFANLGGFLSGLLFGFTGLDIGDGLPETWPARPVVLPTGWRAIAVERLRIRGRDWRLEARHGADSATLTPVDSQAGRCG